MKGNSTDKVRALASRLPFVCLTVVLTSFSDKYSDSTSCIVLLVTDQMLW